MSLFVRTGSIVRKKKRSINNVHSPAVPQRPTMAIALPVPPRKNSVDSKSKSPDLDAIKSPRTRRYGIGHYIDESGPRKISSQSNSSQVSGKLSLDLVHTGKETINTVSPTGVSIEHTYSFQNRDHKKPLNLDNPSYGTLLIQIKETTSEANTSCDFLYRAAAILCGSDQEKIILRIYHWNDWLDYRASHSSVGATVFLLALITVPFAMVIVGVKYLDECPKQPKIPVYLLVGGCFGLLLIVVMVWRQVQYRKTDSLDLFDDSMDNDTPINRKSSAVTDVILVLFHVMWLIIGTVWVFGIWQPNFDQLIRDPNNWCDGNVYMFAVCQILGYYCLTGIALIVSLFLCICYWCRNISDPSFS